MKRMKHQKQSFGFSLGCALVVSLHVHALNLTWDAGNTGNGTTIDPASGNWNTTDNVWNDGANNVVWTQTGTTTPLNSAIFGGTDGAVDAYVVTLASQMAASNLTFNSTGYKLTGSTVSLQTGSGNGSITVAANKTATINSAMTGVNALNQPLVTINSGSVLNLGGAFSSAQYKFVGEGTLNITGGTSSPNVPQFNCAIINQSGGTVSMTAANTSYIGHTAGRSVTYTISGGSLNVNGATTYGLTLGRAMTTYTGTLVVQSGGMVNIGTTGQGSLVLTGVSPDGNSKLDVQGGALTVGTGNATNKIIFFYNGATAARTATMTQSGGTVTMNGIQFGNAVATYDATSLAKLQLSGGTNYVGVLGITLSANATTLPYSILLQGGTLGASQSWSSSLSMKLGTTGGGVTIQAADSGGTARNIILSGILSDDTAVNGTLTKTGTGTLTLAGTNTYSGVTIINEGALQIGDGGTSGQLGTGNVTNNAALVFNRSDDISVNNLVAGTGSVTKLGAGTLTLATGTLYTGNTTVSNGTLVVSESFLADGADVYVSTGAVLKLNFSGIDTIRSLTIGGVLQERSRRYGSSDSSGCFTGSSGFIRPLVGTPPSGTVMLLR